MKLHVIEAGFFKLDGGAMFGIVPKNLWQKSNPADSNNQIELSTRCLLVESENRLVLIDTGLGTKQSEKFFSYYNRWGDHSLERSLKEKGFHKDDITDVFLTHLHFDHCGGAVERNPKNLHRFQPTFKNAIYHTHSQHWEWAHNPNAREKASFLRENFEPIAENGQLNFIDKPNSDILPFDYLVFDGHTEKQLIPKIHYKEKTIIYTADLIPTLAHIPLPYIAGYDVRPLQTLKEKAVFLTEAEEKGFYLFFEHDAHNQMCSLKKTEKGIRHDAAFSLNTI